MFRLTLLTLVAANVIMADPEAKADHGVALAIHAPIQHPVQPYARVVALPQPAYPGPAYQPEIKHYSQPVVVKTYQPEPVYVARPVYHSEPLYHPQPVYHPEPVYQPEPVYHPEPIYQPEPVYHHEPVYQPEPAYLPEPRYAPVPVYQPKPQYPDQPRSLYYS